MTFFGPDLRNGLPIGLGSVAGFGIAPRFSPASLFTGGVQGAWYDPSDSTTLFSDRAGTTPCGTPGGGSVVPVGLMLDKSQGLVLGSELVTNGDFSSGTTGWSVVGGNNTLSVDAGRGKCVSSVTDGAYFGQGISVVANTWYKVTYTAFSDGTSKAPAAWIGNGVGSGVQQDAFAFGTKTFYFRATATGTSFLWFYPGSGQGIGNYILIDDVTVRTVAGNHAIAANDTTARPELRARVNLLTYSEQFDNAAWTKSNTTATANGAVAPDGTTTADLIYPNTSGASRAVYQGVAGATVGASYTSSVYAKASGLRWICLSSVRGTSARAAWFDVLNGVVGTITGGVSASISSVGNGWYRCTVTDTTSVTTIFLGDLILADADNSTSVTANGTNGVLLWGAQLTATNEFPANTYQRISDANTYDAVGFPRYFAANGTSSAMSTPGNVNLSGTDKVTVFAGVRRNSGAGTSFPVEFSSSDANNGSFGIGADSGGAEYFFNSRGTTLRQVVIDNAAYNAPVTNVLTLTSDIAAPSLVARINATQVGSNTSSQGTGNFGNYPLFIGSRNNSTFFLNGNIYGLTVVGSALSAGQITQMEQWLAGKTGISI